MGFRYGRLELAGVEGADLAAWPSHVIFGLYFAVLTLSLQSLHRAWSHAAGARQVLLPLILACLCADLVLVNIQEVYARVDASYGFVAIWDMATFFLWLRALELASSDDEQAFLSSAVVAITPILALGREILFLPYGGNSERAYLDLFFGNIFVCAWTLAAALDATRRPGLVRFCSTVAVCGCFYWIANAAENLLFLAWPPLPKIIYAAGEAIGFEGYFLSLIYAVAAASAVVMIPMLSPRLAVRIALRDPEA